MSTVTVHEMTRDNAILLLAAAEKLGLHASVVRTTDEGFTVPEDVYNEAFPPAKKSQKSAPAATPDAETVKE